MGKKLTVAERLFYFDSDGSVLFMRAKRLEDKYYEILPEGCLK